MLWGDLGKDVKLEKFGADGYAGKAVWEAICITSCAFELWKENPKITATELDKRHNRLYWGSH